MRLTEGFNLLATAPDGIKRLRELILSLAVQGKLVPQDPSDEPASELLQKIRAEKDQLILEGIIKKDKLLPAIGDDEKPFELPQGWEWCRLADIASFENGDRSSNYPSKAHQVDSGVPFVNAGHLINQRVDFSAMNFITPERFELLRSGKVRKGDFLYCLRGSLGKFALVDFEDDAAIASSLIIVRFTKLQSAAFVETYLASSLASDLIRLFDNGTAQPNLSGSDLAKFVFPLPPLAEQFRIVAKVEELMALCDALETRGQLEAEQHARLTATLFDALAASESAHQLQENWTRLAASFDLVLDRSEAVDALEQTLLQLAVRGLLVPQDPADEPASELLKQIRTEKDRLIAEGKIKKDKPLPAITDEEKPFELPQGWEWFRWGQLTKWMTYGFTRPMPHVTTGKLIVTAKNIFNSNIDLSNTHLTTDLEFYRLSEKDRPKNGDILITKDGSIGRAAVVRGAAEFCINQSVAVLWMKDLPLNRDYLVLLIHSAFMQEKIWAAAAGSTIKHISITDFVKFTAPLPPIQEQARIVARVEALRALCGQLRERLAASRQTQAHLAEALVAQT